MILYSYLCGTCDGVTDSWSTIAGRNDPILCSECDSMAYRVVTPVRNTLTANRFNDPGFPTAYERWANQRETKFQKERTREEAN